MKKLTRLLLIHWHYFTREVVAFDSLNFLTGKNASGKSTIIDAMQLVLLGDTSGSFFNKAASAKGNRTLMGYLKGELGDDEDSGFKYLRNGRFSSYIAMEFFDEEKNKYFTGGCCFDVYSENDMQKLFFLYDGDFPENEFVEGKTPWNIRQLREYLRENYPGHKTTDTGREFRTALYGKMGGLRDRFGSLLKKAVSFNPNVDIQQFISEFVCDTQQTVDVSQMQENIRSYKQLENEANILKEKFSQLEQIMNVHASYLHAKQDEQVYSYLIDQSQSDIKLQALKQAQQQASTLQGQLQKKEEAIAIKSNQLSEMQNERNQLQARLLNDEQAQALQLIDTQIADKKMQIKVLIGTYEKTSANLVQYVYNWKKCISSMIEKLKTADQNHLDSLLLSRIGDICEEGSQLLNQLLPIDNIDQTTILNVGQSGLSTYAESATDLSTHTIELGSRIADEQQRLVNHRTLIQQEQNSLSKGIYQFPKDALDLKEALVSRLRTTAKKEVSVLIVAEAAEIENDRWRNVIEGYLSSQKFYIIVPEEYFRTALYIFDSMKQQRKLYGTGLIDIEKLKRKNPTIDSGSLAEEIKTSDPNVRIFLDYILGWVHKCNQVSELRHFKTAVTDEGVLYQNFVVRAMNPERWARPAIGQGAILRRLEAVKQELRSRMDQITACSMIRTSLSLCSKLPTPSQSDIQQAVTAAKDRIAIPQLECDVERLTKSRDAIDQSAVEALKNHLNQLDTNLLKLRNRLGEDQSEFGVLKEKLRTCREESIPQLTTQTAALEKSILEKYDTDWIERTGGMRYQRELSSRGSAEDINKAFPRELSRSSNTRNSAWENLISLRQDYNRKYIMGYDIKTESNDAYDDAWLELSENKLPEYLIRIEDTRKKAFEQFREDFLSRLENNISDAHRQIDGLNTAIKGSSFGEETFRFKIIAKPEYKRYYDMIVDPMKLEGGYNLFSEQFNLKYKDEIAELFAIITNEDGVGSSRGQEDYDKRVQLFTDFRTYLSFDLESINREGEAQRLSKTMGKKSGGETQTPFYIAVLASFAQLYRTGRDKIQNTARLLIFDEAFSKMDGERIVRSVELLRQFNFQVILSAPTEKVGDIGTLVDRNLCVLREGKQTCVKAFDPRRTEWTENE